MTVFGLLVALFGPIAIAVASERRVRSPHRLGALLLAQAGLVATVLVVLAIVFCYERRSAASIGLKSPSLESFAWGLGLAAFFMYVFSPAAYRVLGRLRLGGFEEGLARLRGFPLWYLVLAVVVGGTAEEILYRGYAIERIAGHTGSPWLAGAIPVVVFALAHVPMWGWGPALATLVSGAIFTLFFLWQRDLIACIVAHVVTDFAGIVVGPLIASSSPRR